MANTARGLSVPCPPWQRMKIEGRNTSKAKSQRKKLSHVQRSECVFVFTRSQQHIEEGTVFTVMPEEGRPQRNPLDLTWLVSYKIQNIRLERNKELIDPNTLDVQVETVQGTK